MRHMAYPIQNNNSKISASEVETIIRLLVLIDLEFNAERTALYYARKLGIGCRRLNAIVHQLLDKRIFDLIQERLLLEVKKRSKKKEYHLMEDDTLF
jgi:hypothetical protein